MHTTHTHTHTNGKETNQNPDLLTRLEQNWNFLDNTLAVLALDSVTRIGVATKSLNARVGKRGHPRRRSTLGRVETKELTKSRVLHGSGFTQAVRSAVGESTRIVRERRFLAALSMPSRITRAKGLQFLRSEFGFVHTYKTKQNTYTAVGKKTKFLCGTSV